MSRREVEGLDISDPAVPPNGHAKARVVRRDRRRKSEDGKALTKPKIVHLNHDAEWQLGQLASFLSIGAPTVHQSDLIREALDNFFEAHARGRPCGTVRQHTPE